MVMLIYAKDPLLFLLKVYECGGINAAKCIEVRSFPANFKDIGQKKYVDPMPKMGVRDSINAALINQPSIIVNDNMSVSESFQTFKNEGLKFGLYKGKHIKGGDP